MKKSNLLVTFLILSAAVAALTLNSCGTKTIGYGLVLWSPDEESVPTGNLLPVEKESGIDDIYSLRKPDGEVWSVERWRVRFFKKEKEARRYMEENESFLRTVAITDSDGLRIRENTSPTAQWLYKLKKNEIIKIVSRSAEKEKISEYEDYWYQVLTNTGILGWCYGHNITLREIGTEVEETDVAQRDDSLSLVLENTWRPEYFRAQIDNERINPDEFRPDLGFFPEPDENRIILNTKTSNLVFDYSDIVRVRYNHYLFEGTGLQVKVQSPERIVVEYSEAGKYRQDPYILMDEDINELLNNELSRRYELYNFIIADGTSLTSSSYGTIDLSSPTKFVWEDFERLVPEIIPPGVSGSGKIDFTFFLAPEIAYKYPGAISFYFDEFREKPVTFLFAPADDGIQFTYVPPVLIDEDNLVISREPSVPVIIFFAAEGE